MSDLNDLGVTDCPPAYAPAQWTSRVDLLDENLVADLYPAEINIFNHWLSVDRDCVRYFEQKARLEASISLGDADGAAKAAGNMRVLLSVLIPQGRDLLLDIFKRRQALVEAAMAAQAGPRLIDAPPAEPVPFIPPGSA